MNSENHSDREQNLRELFVRYRDAFPEPEISPNFMPSLWQKIEARQTGYSLFGRMARGFVTAAMAVSCVLALFLALPGAQNSAFETGSYVEVLAAENTNENPPYFDAVLISPVADTSEQGNR